MLKRSKELENLQQELEQEQEQERQVVDQSSGNGNRRRPRGRKRGRKSDDDAIASELLQFDRILERLTLRAADIRDAMVSALCMTSPSSARLVVTKLCSPTPDSLPRTIAKLYVISDILANTSSISAGGAAQYRWLFAKEVTLLFQRLSAAISHSPPIQASHADTRARNVLAAWRKMDMFEPQLLDILLRMLDRAGVADARADLDGEPLDMKLWAAWFT